MSSDRDRHFAPMAPGLEKNGSVGQLVPLAASRGNILFVSTSSFAVTFGSLRLYLLQVCVLFLF